MQILPLYFDNDGPGAALAVIMDGHEAYVECCGLADLEVRHRILPDTVFDLASASKTFTAVAILLLRERGELELSAPASRYLPWLTPPQVGRAMRVRDLLAHTSGLPDYLEAGRYADPQEVTPAFLLDRLPEWSAAARPGVAYVYCNTNYFVLAQLIEAVTGLGFAPFLRTHLFEPFELSHTGLLGNGPKGGIVARGYVNVGSGLPHFERSADFELETLGDGGVFSSLRDLIRWQGLLWGGEVLRQETLRLMGTAGCLDSGESFEYGLGMQVERRSDGSLWRGHGGSWTGTTTLLGRYPREAVSVIVLSNEVMAPVERISQRALAMRRELLGE